MAKYSKRKDGLYVSNRTINGKRKVFYGRTCKEVDEKILAYQEETGNGRKFPVIADEWEAEHSSTVTESTRLTYGYSVRRLKEAFPGYVSAIRPLDVQRYIRDFEKQGRSASGVNTELVVLKQILAYAVISGDIDVNPAAEVKKSRGLPSQKRSALTKEQEALVMAQAKRSVADWWLFGYFLLHTGCRRGEALALSYADIDRKAGLIHINKKVSFATGRPVVEDHLKSENGKRDIPLLPQLAKVLPKNRIGLIFPGYDGRYMHPGELTRRWRAYCAEIGLEGVTPHQLRHSFATICYEAGLDARETAGFLGDSVQVVEQVYIDLRKAKSNTAAERLAEHLAEG